MSQKKEFTLTQEELAERAQGNLVGIIVTVTQFARARGIKAEELWRFVGEKFAPSWQHVPPRDVEEVARGIAENMMSCQAKVSAFTSDDGEVRLVLTGFPPAEAVEEYGPSATEAVRIMEVFKPIARSLNLDYSWSYQTGEITAIIKR